MYDVTNLYIAAEMALYDHEATNENRPQDRYWREDLIQVRLSTDRSLPYPLPQLDFKLTVIGQPAPAKVWVDAVEFTLRL